MDPDAARRALELRRRCTLRLVLHAWCGANRNSKILRNMTLAMRNMSLAAAPPPVEGEHVRALLQLDLDSLGLAPVALSVEDWHRGGGVGAACGHGEWGWRGPDGGGAG